MLLILDIDETLVHTVFYKTGMKIIKRPYLNTFIRMLKGNPNIHVGIWSAGRKHYVHNVVRYIFPPDMPLEFILTREDLDFDGKKPISKVMYLYPHLRKIGIEHTLIIDDKEGVTGFNDLNHLQLCPFEGEEDDDSLLQLAYHLAKNWDMPSPWIIINGP